MKTTTTTKTNVLQKELKSAQAKVDALKADLEQQKILEQQLVALEQKNDSDYQSQLATDADIKEAESKVDELAATCRTYAEEIIELLMKKNEIEQQIKDATSSKTEYAVLLYYKMREVAVLKKKLDPAVKLDHFSLASEYNTKYPWIFSGTPVEVSNFFRNATILINKVLKKHGLLG